MKSINNNKIAKKPSLRNIVRNEYKCTSTVIEKYILGALVKCREKLYTNNMKPNKGDMISKEKESNYKANYILSEILNNPNCPKELKELHCTVLYLTKGGGYQFWGNIKHYISVSFGDDTVLILLN